LRIGLTLLRFMFGFDSSGCNGDYDEKTAGQEQVHTEENQAHSLTTKQPPPAISWSLERDNLIKRFKLQNDRAVQLLHVRLH
jgi:hypothetical protein